MEITLKIEAPGLMEALLAIAEQMQTHNALLAGQPAPTLPVTAPAPEAIIPNTVYTEPVKENKAPAEEDAEAFDLETVRALVISSKTNKEKAKEVMTGMGLKKLTELSQDQLGELYNALKEV